MDALHSDEAGSIRNHAGDGHRIGSSLIQDSGRPRLDGQFETSSRSAITRESCHVRRLDEGRC